MRLRLQYGRFKLRQQHAVQNHYSIKNAFIHSGINGSSSERLVFPVLHTTGSSSASTFWIQKRNLSLKTGLQTTVRSRLAHDVGGDESVYGPIDPMKLPDDLLEWEQQCHSIFAVLAVKKLIRTDELRRSIEALTPDQHEHFGYYEKWTSAMVTLLMDRGVIQQEELEQALFGGGDNPSFSRSKEDSPVYRVGDLVRVKRYQPSSMSSLEWRRPHIRTPGYIYGVAGEIERVSGRFGDPSLLAFGMESPEVQLYRVRFRQRDIWPEQYPDDAEEDDVVEIEIYEHWLEPASTGFGHSFEGTPLFDHSGTNEEHIHHDHHHNHHHHDTNDNHGHAERNVLEAHVVMLEGPPRPGQELFQALRKLLLAKDIVTASELRSMIERIDSAGQRLDGATLVVRAWLDPTFEQRLIDNAPDAARELDIATSNPNAPTVLTVVKNTPTVHNLVVCTLCSCYPSGLLGIAPRWYKSREYRSRAVREPRIVLREEFGLDIPNTKRIRVHDSTADHRYLVLPERPVGTEGWSEEDLRSLVTRDSMVGVAVARTVGR